MLLLFIRYLESLVDYLLGYIERVQPLVDQTELLIKIKKDFEEKWSQGTFPGWKVSTFIIIIIIIIYYYYLFIYLFIYDRKIQVLVL